jgi:hypothetical protein
VIHAGFPSPISRFRFSLNLPSRIGSLGCSLCSEHEASEYPSIPVYSHRKVEAVYSHASRVCTIEAIGRRMGPRNRIRPARELVRDQNGVLYGTTRLGGNPVANEGTVFALTPPATSGGVWTETILYSFGTNAGDGLQPTAGVVFATGGVLYSTTTFESACSTTPRCAGVFSLTPPATSGGTGRKRLFLHRAYRRQRRQRWTNGRPRDRQERSALRHNRGWGCCNIRVCSPGLPGGGCGTVFAVKP